ncbi:hypothetical protein DSUL_100164 [Desulfovibrionales bacterium]
MDLKVNIDQELIFLLHTTTLTTSRRFFCPLTLMIIVNTASHPKTLIAG